MTASPTFLECPVNDGHKLRVEFFQQGDRYAHRLSAVLVDAGGTETVVPLAESVEGASDDPWPPSPPLQSLSIEKLADGRTAALLVGMAGRSHWSASVEVHEPPGQRCQLVFKLACRYSTTPLQLASAYRAAIGIVAEEFDGCVHLKDRSSGVIASVHCHMDARKVRLQLEEQTGQFRIYLPSEELKPPATAQWKYGFDAHVLGLRQWA